MNATGRIPVGVVHRVLCTILVEVHDYDALGVRILTLGKGRLFQPWQPLDHWRGKHVPITLGDAATLFDWSATSPNGHFMDRDDFFERCAPRDVPDSVAGSGKSRIHEGPIADAFSALPSIAERLRAASAAQRKEVDAAIARLDELHERWLDAAKSRRVADGFDNTTRSAEYAGVQEDVLTEARALLSQTRAYLDGDPSARAAFGSDAAESRKRQPKTPRDAPIPVGVVHRVLRRISVEVRDYDSLSVKGFTMEEGRLFQPWEPLDHWRGEHVPITLGDDATQFDWGVTSWEGHFMDWDDFFERCAPRDVAD